MCCINDLTLISGLLVRRAVALDIAASDCADSGGAQPFVEGDERCATSDIIAGAREAPTGWPDARSSVRYFVAEFRPKGHAGHPILGVRDPSA
jgi:hypothetical protein